MEPQSHRFILRPARPLSTLQLVIHAVPGRKLALHLHFPGEDRTFTRKPFKGMVLQGRCQKSCMSLDDSKMPSTFSNPGIVRPWHMQVMQVSRLTQLCDQASTQWKAQHPAALVETCHASCHNGSRCCRYHVATRAIRIGRAIAEIRPCWPSSSYSSTPAPFSDLHRRSHQLLHKNIPKALTNHTSTKRNTESHANHSTNVPKSTTPSGAWLKQPLRHCPDGPVGVPFQMLRSETVWFLGPDSAIALELGWFRFTSS